MRPGLSITTPSQSTGGQVFQSSRFPCLPHTGPMHAERELGAELRKNPALVHSSPVKQAQDAEDL